MDIPSLLSPQETPRTTPTPPAKASTRKPRKPRASKLANAVQSSPLSNTTLPPPTIPHSAMAQAHHATHSPTMMSPTSVLRTSSAGTPSVDGTRTSRQPSTPGMDTLADLASMQHHQQTARANAGGLRSAEIYENPTSSGTVFPNLQAMSRPSVPTLRGGCYDVSMMDGAGDVPSPRTYSARSLSEADLQTVAQLVSYLAANPFSYESHVQLINLLHRGLLNHVQPHLSSTAAGDPHTYDLLHDLQNAREAINARFALGEDLWANWIQDQILLASSLEDRISVMELCQKAVDEETSSTKLWLVYGNWMLSLYRNANGHDEKASGFETLSTRHEWSEEDKIVAREVFSWPQLMNVWKRGAQETMWRLNDSHVMWDTYTGLLLQELASSPSQDAIATTQYHFVNRLQTPHATWDQTFQAYSNFVSKYENATYEVTMVTANRLGTSAKNKYGAREVMEANILRAGQNNDQAAELGAFGEYIEWELAQSRKKQVFDFELANALYQRATLRFPSNTELWEAWAMFLIEEITSHGRRNVSAFPVLERAARHCPWSGTLWSQYLLTAEIDKLPFPHIGDIKHKATSTGLLDAGGMEEVLKVHTAWCGFLRRRAFHQDSTDEEMDVAEVGIRSAIEDMETLGRTKYGKDYQGDPEYRLEKIYIKYLTQSRNWQGARESYKKLISKKGDSYEFWLRYYLWEMATWSKLAYSESDPNGPGGPVKPTEATKVLQQALRRPKLDWPEKIIETYRYHCEDHEDAEELQSSIAQVWKAKKAVQKRREREAYEAYEGSRAEALKQQQQAQQDVTNDQVECANIGKRKREDSHDGEASKKSRPDGNEHAEPPVEAHHPSAPSSLKRDRENTTIIVRNLPIETTETRIRQYFRDCGTINSLKLLPEADGGSATASIEFSKDDVLTAQTKDMKLFDGKEIEVHVGSGSTLYVCNFPPTVDEAWMREKFQKYGEIVDVRFPSLKFNSHRRFCYVQFKSSADAKAATQLDGEVLGDDLKLLAKISDPGRRQERQGPIYEGRELYLANLDWNATKKEIKQAFSKYGEVEKVRVPTKVDGSSKGLAFIVFSNKDEATAALEMNLVRFKNRVLNVSVSTNDANKRQANRIITSTSQRTTASPTPDIPLTKTNGDNHIVASPNPPTASASKSSEIQSRTIALLNVPDTVNDSRIRALAERYGELVKVLLRPDHQGAILEFKDVASVGKATLGIDGQEIAPGRAITVGTVGEMLKQKAEKRSDKIGSTKPNVPLQAAAPIRRPNQPGPRRGARGGLGFKRGGVGLSGLSAIHDEEGKEKEVYSNGEGVEEQGKAKSNADFKAMFLNK